MSLGLIQILDCVLQGGARVLCIQGHKFHVCTQNPRPNLSNTHMSQLLLLEKVEYDGGPIFKVVLGC